MTKHLCSVIAGSGSYIPKKIIHNRDFINSEFYNPDKTKNEKSIQEIIQKFEEITGIKERRYITEDLVASDIGYLAAKDCIDSSNTNKEEIDYIIFAHNFGDVRIENKISDFVPSLASRVKNKLEIKNPRTIAYDLSFGCPGWLQGVIQADSYIKAKKAKKILVIGAETLSRISDPYDRDSMIYSDGAGATLIEGIESDKPIGILSDVTRSDTLKEAYLLRMEKSYNQNYNNDKLFLKMDGYLIYEYALNNVPAVVKESLDKAGLSLKDIKKILIHQANEKMDEAIVKRIFKLCERIPSKEDIQKIMPMVISWLGNSSVATIPTLYDLMIKGKIKDHILNPEENIVFSSVGAGMNINSVVYKIPD